MEKYRQFADGGTGVNPFVPVWSQKQRSPLAVRAGKLLFMLPLAILRILLLGLALGWLALTEALSMLIPIGVLRYPFYRVLTYTGCALALFALGILPLSDTLADHRRLKVPPPKTKGGRVHDAPHGTLVIANLQCFVDILYLGLRLCPTKFVLPSSGGGPVEYSLLGALWRAAALHLPADPPGGKRAEPVSLAEIAQRAKVSCGGPVVVFPEGARTTGSCVLAWKAATFAGLTSFEAPPEGKSPGGPGVALIGLEYSKEGAYTPHHTVGSAPLHAFWMCIEPWHSVRSFWLPVADVASAIKGKSTMVEQTALLRTVLVRMIPGAVEVDVNAGRHEEFMAYWNASQRKNYTHQQRKKVT